MQYTSSAFPILSLTNEGVLSSVEFHNGRSPRDQQQINPHHFMLSDIDRKRSEPAFSHTERTGRESPAVSDHGKTMLDEHLTRSHETENIPDTIIHQNEDRLHPKFTIEEQYRYGI